MTTATLRRIQFIDTHLDRVWNVVTVVLSTMPGLLRRRINEAQLRAWFLRIRHNTETLAVDVNARKHLLLVGGRRLVTRFLLAALLWA